MAWPTTEQPQKAIRTNEEKEKEGTRRKGLLFRYYWTRLQENGDFTICVRRGVNHGPAYNNISIDKPLGFAALLYWKDGCIEINKLMSAICSNNKRFLN